jgi:hypothetical protein
MLNQFSMGEGSKAEFQSHWILGGQSLLESVNTAFISQKDTKRLTIPNYSAITITQVSKSAIP